MEKQANQTENILAEEYVLPLPLAADCRCPSRQKTAALIAVTVLHQVFAAENKRITTRAERKRAAGAFGVCV